MRRTQGDELPAGLVRCANPDCDHEQADHYAEDDEVFHGECGHQGANGGCRCMWFEHPKWRIRPRFAGYCQIGEDGNVSVIALSKSDLPDNGTDAVRVYLDENERF